MISSKEDASGGSIKNKRMAPELVAERANIDFDLDDLRHNFFHNGAFEVFKQFEQDQIEHPALANDPALYEMTREEKQVMWFKKLNYVWTQMPEARRRYFVLHRNLQFQFYYLHKCQPTFNMNWSMFTDAVSSFSTDEQRQFWLPRILNMDIFGCYAQSEIGHGSDVQNLKTTATYDKGTREFIVHTPTIDAIKWWPGELGRIANHALVVAKVLIPAEDDGSVNDYGIGMFIVQIRDIDTHKHMPGVKTGDMGPKFGFSSKDNGWMTLDNVRIRKENMLSRFTSIDEEGCFEMKGDPRILFSTMLKTRIRIFGGIVPALLVVCNVGIRYSIVRRQFKNVSGKKEETQLIEYQTQQMKLFPLIAQSLVYLAGTEYIFDLYDQLQKNIKKNDFKLLEVCHHFSAGMKDIYTQCQVDGMTTIRQSLGGAGYSAWSSLPMWLDDLNPTVTYEGDNTVMAQQCFKYLEKMATKIERGRMEKVLPIFKYLEYINKIDGLKCKATSMEHFLDIDLIEEALKVNICHNIKTIIERRKVSKSSKKDFANSEMALDIVQVAGTHIKLISFLLFKSKVTANGDFALKTFKDEKNRENMTNMALLFGLQMLHENSAGLFQCGYFRGGKPYQDLLLDAIKTVNLRLRPKVLGIVEVFNFVDESLQSAIGNSYGDIYEQHLEWAKDSRSNQNEDAIPDGYLQYMMPILKAKL